MEAVAHTVSFYFARSYAILHIIKNLRAFATLTALALAQPHHEEPRDRPDDAPATTSFLVGATSGSASWQMSGNTVLMPLVVCEGFFIT